MVLNLLRLHHIARNGDGLSPAIRELLVRREAVETNPKVVVLHPGIAAGPAHVTAAGAPAAATAFRRKR